MNCGVINAKDIARFKRMDVCFLIQVTEHKDVVEQIVTNMDRNALDAAVVKFGCNEKAWRIVRRGNTKFSGKFSSNYTEYDIALYLVLVLKEDSSIKEAEQKEQEAKELRAKAMIIKELFSECL